MKRIGQIMVSDDMGTVIRRAASGGAKQFLGGITDGSPLDCSNCGGAGFVYHTIVVGGPFQAVPTCNPEHGETVHWNNGAWYRVRDRGERCGLCGGDGIAKRVSR